jgi:bacterioferritin-associated ferredoxin
MLVCLCHPTSDTEIAAHVEGGARSVEEIGMRCGAGTSCGACRCQIEDMLEELAGDPPACVPGPVAAKSAGPISANRDCPRRPLSIRSRPTSSREAA